MNRKSQSDSGLVLMDQPQREATMAEEHKKEQDTDLQTTPPNHKCARA